MLVVKCTNKKLNKKIKDKDNINIYNKEPSFVSGKKDLHLINILF